MLLCDSWRTVDYYVTRARANLQIIDKLDFVGETSEFARIFGMEFYEAVHRGSQVTTTTTTTTTAYSWGRGVVVNMLLSINLVAVYWARLLLGWLTVC